MNRVLSALVVSAIFVATGCGVVAPAAPEAVGQVEQSNTLACNEDADCPWLPHECSKSVCIANTCTIVSRDVGEQCTSGIGICHGVDSCRRSVGVCLEGQEASACAADDDCVDTAGCRTGVCVAYQCHFTPLPDGSLCPNWDVPPGTPPWTPVSIQCNRGACCSPPASGCENRIKTPVDCKETSDCDDKDDCTVDACVRGKCLHPTRPDGSVCLMNSGVDEGLCHDGACCRP